MIPSMVFMNRLWMQGRVWTAPILKSLNARTKVASFCLSLVESWSNDQGQPRERNNLPLIEVVGKDAERVFAEAKVGSWVTIEGYLRTEEIKGGHVTKVRTLNITIWDKL